MGENYALRRHPVCWIKGQYLWVRHSRQGTLVFVIRKSLGKAVIRNRLKRRLRSLCRQRQQTQNPVVILPQPSAIEAKYTQLGLELDILLTELDRKQ